MSHTNYNQTTTRWTIFNALMTGGPFHPLVITNRIEREDGSNKNYLVTGYIITGQSETIFVKVTD